MKIMGCKINANTKIENKKQYLLSNVEAEVLGISEEDNKPFIVLKYFDGNYQCFSEWPKDKLEGFTNFINKINSTTWNDIYKSAGKGEQGKNGFAYTVHKIKSNLPNQSIVNSLSEDITFFELRVSQEARVHGFRSKSAFCLIWIDQNHDIYPM